MARKPVKKEKSEGKQEREGNLGTTGKHSPSSALTTPSRELDLLDGVLTVVEREILRLVHVERVDIHEAAQVLNLAQSTEAWTSERVALLLAKARKKLERAGELEASRPDAYVAQEARERYDAIIHDLRAELARVRLVPLLMGSASKILKTIADVEKARDEVLLALAGKTGGSQVGALVYVSNLREGPTAAIPGKLAGKPIHPTPP